MNLNKLHKIIRVILISLPILTLVFLVYKNFAFSGKLETSYGFDKNNPVISILKPAGRALKVEQDNSGDYFQSIIIDPVYFDLHMSTTFKAVELTFVYNAPEEQKVKVGPQLKGGDWIYAMEDLECSEKENNWCVTKLKFDLRNTLIQERKLNFIISSPGLDKSDKQIKISEIKAVLTK
ncbi:hypothetical protein HOD96_00765 [Candidatus Falkowbacteria bacterium]|jgi:hypothetical protein|nr:hypothetical protein [Candidatus Falkowbacteria bacterium]MBT4433230.1 hypothetical protein [Candidatus Falkowbacteria bacterium]